MTLAELITKRAAIPRADGTNTMSMFDRFLAPPFSIFDARQGYWQDRKREWLALGIKSEVGRGANLLDMSDSANAWMRGDKSLGRRRQANGRMIGKTFNIGFNADKENDWATEDGKGSGTSIFDPVLCELIYRWFTPPSGGILDPFAGGSVRGVVAGRLGRSYVGVDLRAEQVAANHVQAHEICPRAKVTWVQGDSVHLSDLRILHDLPVEYDFVFSCPPYADLEKYSDDPADLSNMEYDKFLVAYTRIIEASCSMLRDDRFACFVVGDIRNRKTGNYRNFVGDTVRAFQHAGLELYNDAILLTSIGSLPLRINKQFVNYRKLGKTHQNVLVFLKGDAGRAVAACGPVDVEDVEMPLCSDGAVAVCEYGANYACLQNGPQLEVCLMCDVLRGAARTEDRPVPRVWVGRGTNWERIDDNVDLTYVIGGIAYLNRVVFPDAQVPGVRPPAPKKLRGVK